MVTPINFLKLNQLLKESGYDPGEREFIMNRFKYGFPLGYEGPTERCDTSQNIPFSVGDKYVLWEKMMNEVQLKHFAGPFKKNPFRNSSFIQSPVGLVPKSGNKTRLIFHLSFDFPNGNKSINYWTPEEKCSVKYNDLDHAVQNMLGLVKAMNLLRDHNEGQDGETNEKHRLPMIFYSKSDLMSAFRILAILPKHRKYLLMRVRNPVTNEFCYFVEKCLSFGASISCSHFQRFSNCFHHIVEYRIGRSAICTNYLDDYIFYDSSKEGCNQMVRIFLMVCKEIRFLVSEEKTEWATPVITFLGMLIDGINHRISVPEEKRVGVLHILNRLSQKRTATIKEMEQLTGHLNFLTRAIVPGRTFTRRMYNKFTGPNAINKKGRKLKPYHHITLDAEFKKDCNMWILFLKDVAAVNRPFVDLSHTLHAKDINFYSDASKNFNLGFGAIYNLNWTFGKWETGFIQENNPSIEFLELFALCIGVFTWQEKLAKARVIVFCDNESVKHIMNQGAGGCKNSMNLLRMLTLNNLKYDRRIFVKHVKGKNNGKSDALSRFQFKRFFRLSPANVNKFPDQLPTELWPLSKIWQK